ncbi:hypothetical protein GUJ93_ZPchr0012g19766 [Zizania palustris]|uniref:Uncharacterized protein n=1 Tax=Zizania palustris TaxID=103762 RepID=A0A8J5WQV9_ZIZPA|nr:hypothetical protein GUJ93_ZPchr0012g19766 [Zizania palustris]
MLTDLWGPLFNSERKNNSADGAGGPAGRRRVGISADFAGKIAPRLRRTRSPGERNRDLRRRVFPRPVTERVLREVGVLARYAPLRSGGAWEKLEWDFKGVAGVHVRVCSGEMDGKTVRGPDRGQVFIIQVSVAQPVVENDKKRICEVKTRRPNVSDTDSYEAAVVSLSSAVEELLLRILRLRINTQYDISPFTGEPIRPESNPRCPGSLY